MDALGSRWRLSAAVDRALEAGQKAQRAREAGQHDLFGGSADFAPRRESLPDAETWPESQVLAGEKELLGFYLTGHPLRKYESKLRELGTVEAAKLAEMTPQMEVAVGGILNSLRVARSKRGELWASAVLEDLTGTADLLLFPEAYQRCSELLQPEAIVLVRGRLQMEENAPPKIAVAEMIPLEGAEPALASAVVIRVRLGKGNGTVARQLLELFGQKPGEAPVRLELEREGEFEAQLQPEARVRPDAEFAARARAICGTDSVLLI
jgi:DNA polymerase-3 subunit alpha